MKEITESIERLLWFLYRVLFTLLPSTFLFFVLVIFLKFYSQDAFSKLESVFRNFGIQDWIFTFAIIFCINLILESLTHFFFRLLNFDKISQDRYSNDKSLEQLLTLNNKTIYDCLKLNQGRIHLDSAFFNYGLIQGTGKSSWFNNYAWFLISREFLFSNLSISILICNIAFIPIFLVDYFNISMNWLIVFYMFQFASTFLVTKYTSKLLITNYPPFDNDSTENKSDNVKRNFLLILIPIIIFIISACCFLFSIIEPFAYLLLVSGFVFLVCPMLFLRALREYIHVEYLILGSFAKDENNLPPQKNEK